MNKKLESGTNKRLEDEKIVWISTVKPDGSPHLTPVWFIWEDGFIFICIQWESVKARNILKNSAVAAALENGTTPIILEGVGVPVEKPWSDLVKRAFSSKYDWDIETDQDYQCLVKIRPHKWLIW